MVASISIGSKPIAGQTLYFDHNPIGFAGNVESELHGTNNDFDNKWGSVMRSSDQGGRICDPQNKIACSGLVVGTNRELIDWPSFNGNTIQMVIFNRNTSLRQ